ncbi:3-oxoadipate enol-lactonase [Massilia dura]|uniref:3-oxoadipate enol-lactonase n=1 Tax=Pseudoduganella dura TaxID=321982 RepID=A0A6I3XE13_9BURK|nr:3-oxoadipate enol-lactonase [Pseudoduganella dura]MUI10988.1 3-oxoadipate enol-lactonase [Pseudoduganella dura]GGY18531.1 3-oxoadipate enol-lactonase [Pseudoduganella dura]
MNGPDIDTATLNGAACRYRLDGDPRNPAVLLCNSLGTDHTMWNAQADMLSRCFHVVRYDARGHGESGSPPGPYSLEMLASDALALLDHLGIAGAHVVGLSMGGLVAQCLAIYAPHRVNRMVLANTAARIGTAAAWRGRAETVRQEGLADIADSSPARWFTPAFAAEYRAVIEPLQRGLLAQSPEGYAACCDALADADLRDDIRSIAAPVLVMAGDADPVTTVADGVALCTRIRDARLVTLPASHLSNIEVPAAFTRELQSFLHS